MTKPLYAHSANYLGEKNPLEKHLQEVSSKGAEYASAFGNDAQTIVHYAGLWHDIGKACQNFQDKLTTNDRQRFVDHKQAGIVFMMQHISDKNLQLMFAWLIEGHHGGLKVYNEVKACIEKCQADNTETQQAIQHVQERKYPLALEDDVQNIIQSLRIPPTTFEMYLRMLFSALVDADFLATEEHFHPGKARTRQRDIPMSDLLAQFNAYHHAHSGGSGKVAEARAAMYDDCIRAATQAKGLFKLAMPTGGGKTRSGMAFALNHAVEHKMQRIIVAVPFVSITEQTAQQYREIFGDEAVLEHHSGVSEPVPPENEKEAQRRERERREQEEARWQNLAAENWDAPIIVTTTVQLFESLFHNKPAKVRKLHRLANSVIILDEVQALPAHLLSPILDGIKELATHYGATVVLSTATQPAFESIKEFRDIDATDIISNAAHWFQALQRVNYHWELDTPLEWAEIAERMMQTEQCLTIVNTKDDAMALLDAMQDESALHLSTLLCGAHRRDVINTIRQRLQTGEVCRVVSTQVVEAGVDVDFPVVFRALAPLDSIIQAAGRCNREGQRERGDVWVVRTEGDNIPEGQEEARDITRDLIEFQNIDPYNLSHVEMYYKELFTMGVVTDREGIQRIREEWDYPDVAQKFKMIPDLTVPCIIQDYNVLRVTRLLQLLHTEQNPRKTMRRLQPYIVNVKRKDIEGRYKHLVTQIGDREIYLWEINHYHPIRGITDERCTDGKAIVG